MGTASDQVAGEPGEPGEEAPWHDRVLRLRRWLLPEVLRQTLQRTWVDLAAVLVASFKQDGHAHSSKTGAIRPATELVKAALVQVKVLVVVEVALIILEAVNQKLTKIKTRKLDAL